MRGDELHLLPEKYHQPFYEGHFRLGPFTSSIPKDRYEVEDWVPRKLLQSSCVLISWFIYCLGNCIGARDANTVRQMRAMINAKDHRIIFLRAYFQIMTTVAYSHRRVLYKGVCTYALSTTFLNRYFERHVASDRIICARREAILCPT